MELDFRCAMSFYSRGKSLPQLPLLGYCLDQIKFEDIIAEFGIGWGQSTNYLAHKIHPRKLYAFDSFEGIPEKWWNHSVGAFKVPREKLKLLDNVVVYEGLFSDTIPEFMRDTKGTLSLVNIDCDVYSSTVNVLEGIHEKIIPGTILYFDELKGYPDYKQHEYKALEEYISKYNRDFRVIGYMADRYAVGIEILR